MVRVFPFRSLPANWRVVASPFQCALGTGGARCTKAENSMANEVEREREEILRKSQALEGEIKKREAELSAYRETLHAAKQQAQRIVRKPWWRRGWTITIGGIVLLLVIIFIVMVLLAFKNIREGKIPEDILAQYRGAQTSLPGAQRQEPTARTFAVATDDDPQTGPKDAPLVIVEFSDFQCPFCRQAFPILRELVTRYPNEIRFIYRDFPISSIHPLAQAAAEAGECAHQQGKFFEFHDKVFLNQDSLTEESFERFAQELNLDETQFSQCLSSHKYKTEVEKDYQDGLAAGVSGTPTFFVNGRRVPGVISLEIWEQIVQSVAK